ncbi:hypothetical protein [Actinorugispora endophytica]|uniref:Uncharacterized protein n=1 Tax=Actinorugispora endophytica TaxID=1605990 RepID=A0A4V6PWU4_9ACTN|nr:hypothetical protein [Actinorugispora endophytica]TDQ51627.1 hypothetical protein EV190_110120 [Actinorugispora endophytica]
MEPAFHRQFHVRLSLPDRPLEGVTELDETGASRFDPIAAWAQSWANYFGEPVPWTASQNGAVVHADVAVPAEGRGSPS